MEGYGMDHSFAAWMSELLGRKVSPQRGWEYLRGLAMRPLVPRPHHQETTWEEQEAWKKKLASQTKRIQRKHPDANVEVWTMDEQTLEDSLTLRYRLGLKPVLRTVWTPSGEQPIAPVNWRYQWLWLYGFVHPQSGETYWWILPYVRTDIFNLVLADFAKHFQVSENNRIILAMDQAGWHISHELKVPEGIDIILMPSHSPELQLFS
jgi:DDE superfamily endonuclease/Winged helix-turn helix